MFRSKLFLGSAALFLRSTVAHKAIHARQWPGICLHTVYRLEEVASGTRLVERVSVEAPRILRRFVVAEARKSHEETLAKMKTLLEGADAS